MIAKKKYSGSFDTTETELNFFEFGPKTLKSFKWKNHLNANDFVDQLDMKFFKKVPNRCKIAVSLEM